jgi:hypothetical protein
MPTVVTPATGSTYTVRLTVTDETGLQDTADVVVSSSGYTSTAPGSAGTNACLTAVAYTAPATAADSASGNSTTPPSTNTNSGGGGGGGALDWLVLWMLALPLLARAFYRPAMRSAVSNQDF